MNVYDFDGTIYDGDSTVDFYRFALKRHPGLIRYLPKQAWGAALYAFKRIDKTAMKQYFFSFLNGIHTQQIATEFWECHERKLMPWYLAQQAPEDVVISASPEFLLEPICRKRNIRLLASRVDPRTGVFQGENCRGEEKCKRFRQAFPGEAIQCFYSDSLSDAPMANIAQQAFLVRKGTPRPWGK